MKSKEEALNYLIKNDRIVTDLISDGYHTFGELYEHRIVLFMTLCRIMNDYEPYNKVPVWMSKKHSDGSIWDGWFILGLHVKDGQQITYHLPMSKFDECAEFAKELPTAPVFDGHNGNDVLERLKVFKK